MMGVRVPPINGASLSAVWWCDISRLETGTVSLAADGRDHQDAVLAMENERLPDDVVLRKAKGTWQEFLELHDLREAVDCFREFAHPHSNSIAVRQMVELVLDARHDVRDFARAQLARYLQELGLRRLLHEREVQAAVNAYAWNLHDLELDSPGCSKQLALLLVELLGPSSAENAKQRLAFAKLQNVRLVAAATVDTADGRLVELIGLRLAFSVRGFATVCARRALYRAPAVAA